MEMTSSQLDTLFNQFHQSLHARYDVNTSITPQQISVYLAFEAIHKSSGRRVILHLLNPRLAPESASSVIDSLRPLTRIDHYQLPEVFDIGVFEHDQIALPYLVMRHPGDFVPLMQYVREQQPTADQIVARIRSLIELIGCIHRQQLRYLDLKPDHFVMTPEGQVKLLTLGVPASPEHSTHVAATPAFAHPTFNLETPEHDSRLVTALAEKANHADIFSLSLCLKAIVDACHNLSQSDRNYLNRVVEDLNRSTLETSPEREPDLNAYLKRLNLSHDLTLKIPELNPYPIKTLRLPEMIGVSLTPRLRRIIGHPWFQRLQKLNQLGLAYLVYPGARHTRFEHSLGVYHNVTDYVSSLLAKPENAAFRYMMAEEDILTGLMAGLLHDIGHYPFAHALEDVNHVRFNHVRRTYWFLSAEKADELRHLLPCEQSLYDLIKNEWGIAPENIVRILGKPGVTSMDANKIRIFQSIISSPIDADKLDYLVRDSIHTGVQYGRSIDRDRFLQALTINNSRDSLALSEKGRISAEMFMICRYAMYSEVYWHHAVRALHAMIKGAIRYYLDERMASLPDSDSVTDLDQLLLSSSDEQIIDHLEQNGGKTAYLINCLNKRQIYKRALVVRSYDEDRDLFDHLIQVEKGGPHNLEKFRQELRAHLAGSRRFAGLKDEDLLLDIPPSQSIKSVPLILSPSGREIHLGDQSDVWENIRLNFEKWVRKIRFYVHPAMYEQFQKMDRTELVRDIKECAAQFFYRD